MFCQISAAIATACLMVLTVFSPALSAQDFKPGSLDLPFSLDQVPEESSAPVITGVLKKIDDSSCSLEVTVTLPEGSYIYSMNPSFSSATAIKLATDTPLQPSGEWQADRAPKTSFDEDLKQQLEKFHDKVTWSRVLQGPITPGLSVSGTLSGLYCTDRDCRPIVKAKFTALLSDEATAPAASSQTESTPTAANLQTLRPQIGFGKTATTEMVTIDVSLTPATAKPGDEVLLQLKTTVEEGWHIFALDQNPEMAGLPTEIKVEPSGLEAIDPAFSPSSEPEIETPLADITHRVHYGQITWSRRYKVTDPAAAISGSIRFQICEKVCKPPVTAKFAVAIGALPTSTAPDLAQDSRPSETPTNPLGNRMSRRVRHSRTSCKSGTEPSPYQKLADRFGKISGRVHSL